MTHGTTLKLALTVSLIALAGCDSRDPYLRTDVWKPTGANAGNIAAMVADPHDLISGRGSVAQNANEPALAVNHIWLDHPKPLSPGASASGGSSGGSQSGSSDSGGGGSGSSSGTPGS
jgi:type IV pilus biogenesis protein CpaD/CtpE